MAAQVKNAVRAVILVGSESKGTRFRPLSLDVPKPLCSFAGEPLLWAHIRACAKVENLVDILLLGCYGDKHTTAFQNFAHQAQKEIQVPVEYLSEPDGVGAAGSMLANRERLIGSLDKNSLLMVLHGDALCDFPLQAMSQAAKARENSVVTLLAREVEESTLEDPRQYGCLVANKESDLVEHYVEKPDTFVSRMVNCGVYVIRPISFFAQLEKVHQKLNTEIPDTFSQLQPHHFLSLSSSTTDKNGPFVSLERHIFPALVQARSMFVYPCKGWWTQIKTPTQALCASAWLLSCLEEGKLAKASPSIVGHVFIHPSATVDPSAKLGPNVSIGENVIIGYGARIANSIILDEAHVQDHACILHSIIGWESVIGRWARIEGIPKATDTDQEQITILGKGVKVSPELIIRASIILPFKELRMNTNHDIIL